MKLQGFTQFKIDKLKFNSGPTKQHQSYIDEGTPLLTITAGDIPIKHPHLNSSNKVKLELQKVKSFQSSERAKGLAEKWDTGFLNKMESVVNEAGYNFDSSYFEKLADTLRNLVIILKYKYNRPRPYQLAEYHNIELEEFETHTSKTPSYPSGHSLQAMGVVLIANELYQDKELNKILLQMAYDVADSRVAGGLHLPSDNGYSFEIARYINKFIIK
tara:strand:- start:6492 stop:7139 length:648 start_codon:yes stop_codon:yes gene_type:complete